MNMVSLIEQKKAGLSLSKSDIDAFISDYTAGLVPDYQASALLMAIRLKGMNREETANLTESMRRSGDQADLSAIGGIKVDKHSTGGVADTTTLITIPVAAACGVKVAKMSGRGLGHTGGTLDKLESIPGYNIALTPDQFAQTVSSCGCSVIGQSGSLAPADKKLYALRDVTGTVDSLPLIASSIMSKKLASGSDALILDVKTGSGAFLHTPEEAAELAEVMCDTGKRCSMRTAAFITDMNQPLGRAIGNSLEVIEAAQILKGSGGGRLKEVALQLAAAMIVLAKLTPKFSTALQMASDALKSGAAFERLESMIRSHGGNPDALTQTELLPRASCSREIRAKRTGYISRMQTDDLGRSAMLLGAGRASKESEIDLSAGIWMECELGDFIREGDLLARFYTSESALFDQAEALFRNSLFFEEQKPELHIKPIYRRIGIEEN